MINNFNWGADDLIVEMDHAIVKVRLVADGGDEHGRIVEKFLNTLHVGFERCPSYLRLSYKKIH